MGRGIRGSGGGCGAVRVSMVCGYVPRSSVEVRKGSPVLRPRYGQRQIDHRASFGLAVVGVTDLGSEVEGGFDFLGGVPDLDCVCVAE
jgi:hypothetical protein